MHEGDKTASKYVIKDIGGTDIHVLRVEERGLHDPSPQAHALRPQEAAGGLDQVQEATELYATDRMGPKADSAPDSRSTRTAESLTRSTTRSWMTRRSAANGKAWISSRR